MKQSHWVALSKLFLALCLVLTTGCGGEPFSVGDFTTDASSPSDSAQDVLPDQVADSNQEPKPDADAAVPETGPEAAPEAGQDAVAEDAAVEAAIEAGEDAMQPEASPEPTTEPQPEASVEAEAATPEPQPEAGADVQSEVGHDATAEPDVVQPDAPPDVNADVPVEDGSQLTDCQKWGVAGKVRIIMTYALTSPMPLGEVMAVYGEFTYYMSDGGVASQGYAVWDTASHAYEIANVVLTTPVPATTNIDFTFEPSTTSVPHTSNIANLNRRCDSMGCPVGDAYKVCVGTDEIGGFANSATYGSCIYELDVYNKEQINCTH